MGKAENHVERYLLDRCEAEGFLCYKFVSPGRNGMPDRVVIGAGKVVFVETKAPGGQPRKLQLVVHEQMRARGADVRVISTRKQVDDFIKEITQ